MPGFDGTGPFGTGSVGRGRGPCCGGYGWTMTKEDQKKVLEAEKEQIEKKLKELE